MVGLFLLVGCKDKGVPVAQEHAGQLLAAVMSYHEEFGEYPTGTDLEVSLKLSGANPELVTNAKEGDFGRSGRNFRLVLCRREEDAR